MGLKLHANEKLKYHIQKGPSLSPIYLQTDLLFSNKLQNDYHHNFHKTSPIPQVLNIGEVAKRLLLDTKLIKNAPFLKYTPKCLHYIEVDLLDWFNRVPPGMPCKFLPRKVKWRSGWIGCSDPMGTQKV